MTGAALSTTSALTAPAIADPSVLRSAFDPKKVWLVVVISNPVRWQSRIRLAKQFLTRMRHAGVSICLVEHAFGDRPHDLAGEQVDIYLPIRGYDNSELWLKESLIRYGMARVPHSADVILWGDADTAFADPNWLENAWHALQHWPVIQPWSRCMDLGPDFEPVQDEKGLKTVKSFGKACFDGDFMDYDARPDATKWGWTSYFTAHVGYFWGARRPAIDGFGGVIDWIPTGAADWQMAMAFMGRVTPNPKRTDAFNKRLLAFQMHADPVVKQSVGYSPGLLTHYHHGPKRSRGYESRDTWLELFDPDTDLVRDTQGILVLTGANRQFRDFLRRYMRSRNEDSVEV